LVLAKKKCRLKERRGASDHLVKVSSPENQMETTNGSTARRLDDRTSMCDDDNNIISAQLADDLHPDAKQDQPSRIQPPQTPEAAHGCWRPFIKCDIDANQAFKVCVEPCVEPTFDAP
jgi:hypothetical protein